MSKRQAKERQARLLKSQKELEKLQLEVLEQHSQAKYQLAEVGWEAAKTQKDLKQYQDQMISATKLANHIADESQRTLEVLLQKAKRSYYLLTIGAVLVALVFVIGLLGVLR